MRICVVQESNEESMQESGECDLVLKENNQVSSGAY